jgi:hypothetical protein
LKFLDTYGKEVPNSPWLTKGKEYIVLGLFINKKETKLYLESDDGQAAYFDIQGFEILSNYIPSNWNLFYQNTTISLYPKKWKAVGEKGVRGFWEGYTDGELEMVELYEQERDLIYGEEPT